MYVPLIEKYRSLNIPAVHNGNTSHHRESPQDLQQHTVTIKPQYLKMGEKEPSIFDKSEVSFAGSKSGLKAVHDKQSRGLSKVDSPFRRSSLLYEGANVASPPNEGKRERPNGKHGIKRLRTKETELARSMTPERLKRRKMSNLRNVMAGLCGVPVRFNIYISNLLDEGSERSDKPKDGKRSISTIAEQSISSKRRKLDILENVTYSRTKDIFDFIPQYEGLNVPTICSKMQE